MKKAIIVGLIGLVLVLTAFATSILLTPQPSDGTNGTFLLQIVEVVWDGGIWNGQYEVEIFNPTDRIIEGSIYIFIENTNEKWDFIKCGNRFVERDIPLTQTFYPNSTTKVYTLSKDYFYSDNVEVIILSGDHYILEETTAVRKWIRIEVIDVKWGEMVNRSYEPETARWVNFTIFNYGEDTQMFDFPIFRLDGDKRSWTLQHGTNQIKMMGDTRISNYQLFVDDKLIWKGTVQEG